jgi:hypothetical protein
VATYLRQEIIKYTNTVKLAIDFNKFSDNQIKNIIKQVKNGCVSLGNSATATVAKWLMRKYPMPHFKYDTYYYVWDELPNGHPFFEMLKQQASISKLSTETSNWQKQYSDEAITLAEKNEPSGSVRVYHYDKHSRITLKKTMKLDVVLDGELKDFLDNLQNRKLGVVDVEFLEFANSY